MDHLERSLFGTPLVYFTCLKIFQENYYSNNLFQRLQYVPGSRAEFSIPVHVCGNHVIILSLTEDIAVIGLPFYSWRKSKVPRFL